MGYFDNEMEKTQAALELIEGDNSVEAQAKRIRLIDHYSNVLSDLADEVERRGDSVGATGLRQAAAPMKSFAHEEAQNFLRLITTQPGSI